MVVVVVTVVMMMMMMVMVLLASPAGTAMPPAGLCFTDDFLFFYCRPSHSTTAARI